MGSRPSPLRPKASNHRGAREDATDQPEDAPERLQVLILLVFIDQHGLQTEPLRPKTSNHRGGRRGCSQSGRGCPHERLQELISLVFIDQNALETEPFRPKPSNHRGGRRSPQGPSPPSTGGQERASSESHSLPGRGGCNGTRDIYIYIYMYIYYIICFCSNRDGT